MGPEQADVPGAGRPLLLLLETHVLGKEHLKAAHYATKDHLLPVSHGGTEDWINTVLACNRLKANRLPTKAELIRHSHIYALFNERVELRRAEIEAKERLRAASLPAAPAAGDEPTTVSESPHAEPTHLDGTAPAAMPDADNGIGPTL